MGVMGTAGLRGTGAQRVRTQRPGAWRATWLDGTLELQCHACAVWVDVGVAYTRKEDM